MHLLNTRAASNGTLFLSVRCPRSTAGRKGVRRLGTSPSFGAGVMGHGSRKRWHGGSAGARVHEGQLQGVQGSLCMCAV